MAPVHGHDGYTQAIPQLILKQREQVIEKCIHKPHMTFYLNLQKVVTTCEENYDKTLSTTPE